MKAVILAGGFGTRISEESNLRPKPMITIGEKPILWHIMKIYSNYGIKDFVICLGYKGYVIKEYFINYYTHMSDLTVDLSTNDIQIHSNNAEKWKVTLVDTGLNTLTGGRIKRIEPFVRDEDAFCLTYGDGVSDVNINQLIDFHRNNDKLATLTAIKPMSRFGVLQIEDGLVSQFHEKPKDNGAFINGGFFVLSPKVLDYINHGDDTVFEQAPLKNLAKDNQLQAYKHDGFWQPMDTLRDKNALEALWESGAPPWKVW